ncbi:MAG TPA: cytochrome c [Pyrinomonadaceae bacterium]|nr:cytochrome c [Pyrinomonadaceae bacterium]
MNFLKITVMLSSILLFGIACSTPSNTNSAANANSKPTNANTNAATANTQPTAADELASARKIYKEKCATCHKEDGTGGKVDIEGTIINAENLTTDKMKKMEEAKYIDVIENGIKDEGMPAYKGKLTDQEIKDVVKFIRKEFQKQ